MPTLPLADLAAFITALDELVPDSKGNYSEAGFIAQGIAKFSDSIPCVESVDLGDGSTRSWVLPGALSTDPFYRWSPGFSDRWPVEIEQLTTSDLSCEPPEEFAGSFRVEHRTVAGVQKRYLVLDSAPASTSKVRVRFSRPYIVRNAASPITALVEVPQHFQMAVLYAAAAEKCDALAAFYRASIDPAGGSDIFDARQYADSYNRQADRFREQFAELSGVGDEEQSFSTGQVRTNEPTIFNRGHDTGRYVEGV